MYLKTSNQPKLNIGVGKYTCNWGLHIAGLYETEQERDDIIFGFLKQGCLDKDLQLYCPTERTLDNFKDNFSNFCPDCNDHMNDTEIFQFFSAKELYYPNGSFSPEAMDEGLNNFFDSSQENGKVNIRAAAEMAWALEAIPGVDQLMIYESRLNNFIEEKPWVSVCLYNLSKFDGKTIMSVLHTHPYTISKGIIIQNPYYQKPEKWLAENAPEYA